jgi:H+-translocating NAD(P) transhydrogenase subunit alpha
MNLLFQPMALIASLYLFADEPAKLAFNPLVLIASLYVFALAAFLGYQVISRVPPLLHTPLMSATNAISGISLIGSLVIAGSRYDHYQTVASILGCLAVTSAMINVTGGFLITDRMLKMFRKKEVVKAEEKK